MFQQRFEITRVPATEDAAAAFVKELDLTIDELQNNLHLAWTARRTIAAAFGIDRREDASKFGAMADAARRAEYEGEGSGDSPDGKLVPRGKAA